MNFKKKKLTAGDATFNVINYLVFGIFTLICIYPFYYMVINTVVDILYGLIDPRVRCK